jgi:hypothetical protein
MKMKYLLLALLSICSINISRAEIVPGFSVSETYSPSGVTTVGFYTARGYGGNLMSWSVQNQADVATNLTPNIYVDFSLKSNEEVRLLAYQTEYGEYEVAKTTRTNPYEWEVKFDLNWSSDDALVKRQYWFIVYANDWNSKEYENLRLRTNNSKTKE